MSISPNICSIPAGCNFLATLAHALVHGTLVEGFVPFRNPILLQSATIYVPTRRAARTLSAEILKAMETKATILPAIRTLGDADDEELHFFSSRDLFELSDQIGDLERKIHLYAMVQHWTDLITKETRALFGDEDIVIPSSPGDAMWLAQDLAALMDQMTTEEVDWSKVAELKPEEQPQWWQLTIAFLKIAIEIWPQHLEEIKRIEAGYRRRLILDGRAQSYAINGSQGPVIAAGSTGTIPATARLLKAISKLPNGCVVLPGFDHRMNEESWQSMLDENELVSAPNLSQHGLARFVSSCGVNRADIKPIGELSIHLNARERLFSLAMSAGESSHAWFDKAIEMQAETRAMAIEKMVLIEASGVRQEAMAIALAMREVLESNDKTVALVTPDRKIARRVASELKRYDINIDDSGGEPLQATPSGQFIRMLLETLNDKISSVDLVALIKHPFCRLGMTQREVHSAVGYFELALVRGTIERPTPGRFAEHCMWARQNPPEFPDPRVEAISSGEWDHLQAYCQRFDQIMAPFAHLREEKGPISAARFMELLAATASALSVDEHENSLVFGGVGGAEYRRVFDEFGGITALSAEIELWQFAGFFEAIVGERAIRDPGALTHPRLHILGPLEARLHHFDRVILAGLNEGTWPPNTRSDPFLNRVMRAEIGLSPPERRIGLSAHDFQQLAGNPEFFMVRSTQVDNTPTIASRWIQRLCAIIGENGTKKLQNRGTNYTRWAEQFDQPPSAPIRTDRPNPKPPIAARPRKMSVSDVETWIRDPYSIYAKHVLKLRPVEPLDQEVGPALKGSLYHEILGKFVQSRQTRSDQNSTEALMDIARQEVSRLNLPEDTAGLWISRFQAIAEQFILWDAERLVGLRECQTELSGNLELSNGTFRLIARADRIDLHHEGDATILDYKSGDKPSATDGRGLSPQLPLEGAILRSGGYLKGFTPEVRSLAYVRLKPGSKFKADSIETKNLTANQLCDQAREKLEAHILAYQNIEQGYISRFAPKDPKILDGDYDHLARTREWYSGGSDDESGDD